MAKTDDRIKLKKKKRNKGNKRRLKRALPIVGWREWVVLPELGLDRIKAKIDTGARTSALHVTDLERSLVDGTVWLRFLVHPMQRKRFPIIEARAPLLEDRYVRSSNGRRELRPVVLTELLIGDTRGSIELTLTNRDVMGFRLLLGRQAIRRRFVVDPGRSFRMSTR